MYCTVTPAGIPHAGMLGILFLATVQLMARARAYGIVDIYSTQNRKSDDA